MKRCVFYLLSTILFVSCVKDDDGFCNCTPPPGHDEILAINLKNKQGENLLLKNTSGYLPLDQYTFYLITGDHTINLTKSKNNSSFFEISEVSGSGYIIFRYGWNMKNDVNTKEGQLVIDYNNSYPNDTIYMKYTLTPWEQSDKLIEVKLNGEYVVPDSLHYNTKVIEIVK